MYGLKPRMTKPVKITSANGQPAYGAFFVEHGDGDKKAGSEHKGCCEPAGLSMQDEDPERSQNAQKVAVQIAFI